MTHDLTHSFKLSSFLAGALAVAPGCYSGLEGQLDDQSATNSSGPSDGSTGSGGAPEPDPCATGACEPVACDAEQIAVGHSPLRRLTRIEYLNTVRDLLNDSKLAPAIPELDSPNGSGFKTNDIPVDALVAEAYVDSAEALAATIVDEKLAAVSGCALDDAACVDSFVLAFAGKAYRRPLTGVEAVALAEFHADARTDWGARDALAMALQAVLSSPSFLYLVEVGEPAGIDGAPSRLTDHELASRLSYFLWQSMPDDDLRAAADAGTLHDPAALEEQVRRMLGDDKVTRGINRFHEEWLHLDDRLGGIDKDAEQFPEWDDDLQTSMLREVRRFAQHVLREDDGRLATLLAAPYTVVDATMAAFYGYPAPPAGESVAKVDTDPEQRRGLLSTAAFLAGHAHYSDPSWVQRGLFVRTQVFCQVMPPPPPDVPMDNLNNPDRTTNPACQGCHLLMDPIGQGMDNFDAIGRFDWSGDEGALEPGRVEGDVDIAGDFTGLADLAVRMSTSRDVQDCVARQWFRFATRRIEDSKLDKCTIDDLLARFDVSKGDVRELMVAIALSDGFRHVSPAPE